MVVTETNSRATSPLVGAQSGEGAATARRSRLARLLPSRRLSIRFSRYTAGSVLSTVISQLTLTGLYWAGGVSATTASLVAFVAGALPNFVINYCWAWGRKGKPALMRELVPYLAIVIGGGVAATMLTTLTAHIITPLVADRGVRAIALDLAYLSSYGVLFIAKFALMDKVFNRGAATAEQPQPVPSTAA